MDRHVREITVGMHEGRVGFTLAYEDGETAHFLFHPRVARDLADRLRWVTEDFLPPDRPPATKIGVRDTATVRLTPPREE
jgi:hypothetical protein